jgi:hypothetical protein
MADVPFQIPDLETADVQPKGPPVGVPHDPFHQQLGLCEHRVTGVARFPVAWTTPNRSDAVTRQAPGSEFPQDETTERFLVHFTGFRWGGRPLLDSSLTEQPNGLPPSGSSGMGREYEPVSGAAQS